MNQAGARLLHPVRGVWSYAVAVSLIHLVEEEAAPRTAPARVLTKAPVIPISRAGDPTLLALTAEATEFMQKPVGRGQLLSVPERVPGQRRSHG